MAGKLAGPKRFRDDKAVIWKSNQIFKKSDPSGDVSQEASPFRFWSERWLEAFFAEHPELPSVVRLLLTLQLFRLLR
jgi:hypothetical protein